MTAMNTEAFCLPWQESLLQRALDLKAQQRLPHALIIESSSDQAIDKFIHGFIRLLLCQNPVELSPCGECDACRLLQAGTYADFSFVTLETNEKTNKINKNIKIEQIRNLIHEVTLTKNYDSLKVAVIYPAEAMSLNGANALLKTLEEPAAGVFILLVTHNLGRIPITLRSRSQIWSMKSAEHAEATRWLEQQGLEQHEITDYLAYANGDPLLAVHLKENNYSQLVDNFKSAFGQFMRNQISVSGLCKELRNVEVSLIRRLIDRLLKAYCYQMCGTDSEANPTSRQNLAAAQVLFELQRDAQRQLSVEENNLDLQIQLEDVLISLKQILTRRPA
ncbi:MAG: DNA polymerase III subunit delta' [Pseudomonadota bacterium]